MINYIENHMQHEDICKAKNGNGRLCKCPLYSLRNSVVQYHRGDHTTGPLAEIMRPHDHLSIEAVCDKGGSISRADIKFT